VEEMSAPPPLRRNEQVPSQPVQAPNVNSSSLNYIFTVVAMVLQQIMTELSGAESEAITNIALKLMKQNGC
jgi:hypothetical protein